ncbi:MAG: hypothetical protein V1800_10880 [Candidatus Latescibacterota bacterium]
MLKNKILPVVLAGLLLTVAVYNWRFFSGSSSQKKKPAVQTAQNLSPGRVQEEREQDLPLGEGRDSSEDYPERSRERGWGRNPFLTPEETAPPQERMVETPSGLPEKLSDLEVNTILVGGSRSIAIMGGHTIAVGDWIGEEQVLEINPDHVVLGKNGGSRAIRLRESTVPLVVKEGK